MSKITVYIDAQPIECEEGESILQVARKNDLFIPAICYLHECSPTLACKLCMVEADGKRVYSCNAKTKNGMRIITDNEEMAIERRAIMSVYDINHPLECGVCDKSGECELQNYSLMMGVYHQEYAVKDSYKKKAQWGHALYDPNLCIVCERCITSCKDKVGNNFLKTIKRDADAPDKSYKDTMPKDAFGVWNKMSKSLIGFVGNGDCEDCSECISVCPVGALGEDHFHYASNAWELDKISSSCPHCPLGCSLTYEGKHGKIYRVSNDWNFGSLCGAGRYGYEIPLRDAQRDHAALKKATDAFLDAQTISFGNFITNEEAHILQILKEQQGYRLYNPTAREYQKFLWDFISITNSLYTGDTNSLKDSDCIITLGTSIRHDVPVLKYKINNTLKMLKGSSLINFHPTKDNALLNLGRNVQSLTHAMGEEENITFLIMQLLNEGKVDSILPQELKDYLRNNEKILEEEKITTKKEGENTTEEKEIIKTYKSLIAEQIGLDTQAVLDLKEKITKAQKITIIAGSDLYHHPQSSNIAKALALLDQIDSIQVILLPPEGNALGVALICDLDDTKEGYTIGYNKQGDYILSSLSKNHPTQENTLLMPSVWQQFGSFTTLDKRVVPLLPAYEYHGFDLSDIASALGGNKAMKYKNTKKDLIDYTSSLPMNMGYKNLTLEQLLEQEFYILESFSTIPPQSDMLQPPTPTHTPPPQEGVLLYGRDAESQFSPWSYDSSLLRSKGGLYLSKILLEKLGLEDGMSVEITSQRGSLQTIAYLDSTLDGEIAALALGLFARDEHPIFESANRFARVSIKDIKEESLS